MKGWVSVTRRPEEGVGECYEKARGRGGYGFREAQRKGVNHVLRENQRKGWWWWWLGGGGGGE